VTPKRGAPKAAAVYARISLDRAGEGLGVERQVQLCRKLAKAKGWPIAGTYVDNATSAYRGKARPHYGRMLGDIERGVIDAVVCVDLDRLTRRPIELEHFMDLADRHGIALANVSGDTDLSTSDGRLKARIMGAVARQESEKKGERVSREAEHAARRGVARGARRPFGYEDGDQDPPVIDPDTGKARWRNKHAVVHEGEAELVREAARRVMAGESASAVARDWNGRGVPTPQGAPHGWSGQTITGILRNPRIAGLRRYKGEVVSEQGRWPAILDRADWEAVQGRIRRTARPGRPSSHLLSGIARCARCDGPLWAAWRKNRRGDKIDRYACMARPGRPGCGRTSVVAAPLEDVVRDTVIAALAGPRLARARRRARGRGRDRDAATALARAEHKLEALAVDHARDRITRREWLAARDDLNRQITEHRRALDVDGGPLADLPSTHKALRQAWDAGTVEWRRALLDAVIDAVIVKPGAPATSFDPDRISIHWRV
jgi:site-specific DNA recombinase